MLQGETLMRAEVIGPTACNVPKIFAPTLTEEYRERLQELVLRLIEEGNPRTIDDELIAISGRAAALRRRASTPAEIVPTHAYLTALLVLRDLVGQGYQFELRDGMLEAVSPWIASMRNRAMTPEEIKEQLRASYQFARTNQLQEPATAGFIRSIERKGVLQLVARGSEIMERLRRFIELDPETRATTLVESRVIQPVLELVETGARDHVTGLLLQDVWRYFRYYWSIPYQTQPGRNMFYLIRDAAISQRPVIGIAALGNAPIQLTVRDNWIGWTVDGVNRMVGLALEEGDREFLRALASILVDTLTQAIGEVRKDDLIDDEGVLHPTDRVINHLRTMAHRYGEARVNDLRLGEESRDLGTLGRAFGLAADGEFGRVDWQRVSDTFLYKSKRARHLAKLLYARLRFTEAGLMTDPEAGFRRLLQREDGRRALRIALQSIKTERVGTSMMELTVCGAIPPYSYLLGGKLVAMLMTSPQVYHDYVRRYSGQPSYIASAMKGAPVLRPAELVFIEVTSLYHVGSSQYNRLRIPAEALEEGRYGEVRFTRLGLSESFGSVHFTPQTSTALSLLAELKKGIKDVNHIFGEGHSPRFRKIRAGIDALGLNSEAFLRHDSPRIVYGVPLIQNTTRYLLRLDSTPSFIFPMDDPVRRTRQISDYWTRRWLASRLQHQATLQQVSNFEPQHLALSMEAENQRALVQLTLFDCLQDRVNPPVSEMTSTEMERSPLGTGFLKQLYRSIRNQADHLDSEEIAHIHVETQLDDFLRKRIRDRFQLIITGNPGDGKTHLVRRLKYELTEVQADVIEDANEVPDEEIIARWRRAALEGRPFCLAINEGPLYALLSRARKDPRPFPEIEEAWRQVDKAIYYHPEDEPEPPVKPIRVIDLGLRNLLTGMFIKRCITKLTDDMFFQDVLGSDLPDPALWNRERLRNPRVQERLIALIERVARRGYHATMRQLLGFIAFLLVGAKDHRERLLAQGDGELRYYNLAFSGEGDLFDAIRKCFDPALVTEPKTDECLWIGATDPNDWLSNGLPSAPENCSSSERALSLFRSLKRRFFFEHKDGLRLLEALPPEDVEFQMLMGNCSRLVDTVIVSLNRFYARRWDPVAESDLYLWTTHRYHADAPTVFVANQRVGPDRLEVLMPQLAPWVREWLSSDMYLPDHFAVVSKDKDSDGNRAILKVDFDLYCTLRDAAMGLVYVPWSRNAKTRIVNFIDQLRRIYEDQEESQRLRVFRADTGQQFVIRVRRYRQGEREAACYLSAAEQPRR